MQLIISTSVFMLRSSSGPSKTIYATRAQYSSVSAFVQNSSPSLPLPLVLLIRALTNFSTSLSVLI